MKVKTQRDKIASYLNELCEIEKKMYNGNKREYLFHNRNLYLDYEDFRNSLPKAKYKFLSNKESKFHEPIKLKEKLKKKEINLVPGSHTGKIIRKIQEEAANHYVLSSSKNASSKIFNQMIAE